MGNQQYQHEGVQRVVGEDLQAYLERIHSTQLHPKRSLLFSLAYEHGHAMGEGDVASAYADMVPLVQP